MPKVENRPRLAPLGGAWLEPCAAQRGQTGTVLDLWHAELPSNKHAVVLGVIGVATSRKNVTYERRDRHLRIFNRTSAQSSGRTLRLGDLHEDRALPVERRSTPPTDLSCDYHCGEGRSGTWWTLQRVQRRTNLCKRNILVRSPYDAGARGPQPCVRRTPKTHHLPTINTNPNQPKTFYKPYRGRLICEDVSPACGCSWEGYDLY